MHLIKIYALCTDRLFWLVAPNFNGLWVTALYCCAKHRDVQISVLVTQLQIPLFECLSWTLTLTLQLRKLKTHMTFESQKRCLAVSTIWQMSSLTLYPGPTALFCLAPYYNAAEIISISVLTYSSLINISLTHLPVSPDDITMVICPGIGNHSEKHYIRTFVDYAQKDGYRCAVLNHLGALPNIELTSPRMFTYGEAKNLVLNPGWGQLLCISTEWKFKSVVH